MKTHQLSPRSLHRLTLAVLASGFIFSSSAHAIFVSESHACKSNSQTGGAWVGGYYKPATSTAVTHQVNERFNQVLNLRSVLWAYPEGGTTYTKRIKTISTPAGVANNRVSVSVTNPSKAPGSLLTFGLVWHPNMSRSRGTFIPETEDFSPNGCRNRLVYF